MTRTQFVLQAIIVIAAIMAAFATERRLYPPDMRPLQTFMHDTFYVRADTSCVTHGYAVIHDTIYVKE